ncbi:MAG: hypothetical protein MIO87_02075 [Methanomassiliicoccales archaeon]|nr:hypothetical protein [Methanomassiliicoccales archaeon]TFG55258.1 MAG: hypothetical protein E4H30_07620 [Methanomassiliicoccus sp.]
MNDEDSKEMAAAGSHGVEYDVRFNRPLNERELIDTLRSWMKTISSELTSERGIIGHIKAFFRCQGGWVRLNLVDLRLDLDVDSSIEGDVRSGRMKIMAALVGMKDGDIAGGMDRGTSSFKHDFSDLVRIGESREKEIIKLEG